MTVPSSEGQAAQVRPLDADPQDTRRVDKPICYDLYCGLGGWTEGFLAEDYTVIGFDIEQRPYPGQLVLQDIRTIHGAQLANATCIVASSPCQEFSIRAMPWKTSRAIKPKILPPWWKKPEGDMTPDELAEWFAYRAAHPAPPPLLGIDLFYQSLRIQYEASEAAGRYIPLVMENVKGAQKWIGDARWHYGSFYLWGDVPALMPTTQSLRKSQHSPLCGTPDGTGKTSWFYGNSKHEGRFYGTLDSGDPEPIKVAGQNWSRFAETGETSPHWRMQAEGGTKVSGDWFGAYADQKAAGTISPGRLHGKGSAARKAASAAIAKIPLPLARHIAQVFKPYTPVKIFTAAKIFSPAPQTPGYDLETPDRSEVVASANPTS